MDILQRYLTKKLIFNFSGGIFLFVVLFIFSKFSEQINHFVKILPHTPVSELILYFIYEIPFTSIYVLPMSTLFSIVYVLGRLNESHELSIFRTTGKSIWYHMAPFIIFIFILCALISIFNEKILYLPHQKHRALHHKFRQSDYHGQEDRKNLIQFGTDHKLYVIDLYQVSDQSLNKVKIYYLDQKNRFKKIIVTDKLTFKEETTWKMDVSKEFNLEEDQIKYLQKGPTEIDLGDKLFYFKRIFHTPEDLSTRQIEEELNKVKTIGGNSNPLLTEYHFKMASPYISFILIFLGVPLSTFSRKSVTTMSFFLVIITAFIYMVFFNIGISLGKSGVINPLIGGWLGNIVFSVASLILNILVRR